jgi:hypothetical protein
MRQSRILLLAAIAAGACHGPSLHLDNPDAHPVFVDGVRLPAADDGVHTLPFRYYGTTRWDAVPKDLDGDADWELAPASAAVVVAPPASPLWFPLDLPLEIGSWLLHGQPATRAAVVLPATNAAELATTAQADRELAAVRQRADEARIQR